MQVGLAGAITGRNSLLLKSFTVKQQEKSIFTRGEGVVGFCLVVLMPPRLGEHRAAQGCRLVSCCFPLLGARQRGHLGLGMTNPGLLQERHPPARASAGTQGDRGHRWDSLLQ